MRGARLSALAAAGLALGGCGMVADAPPSAPPAARAPAVTPDVPAAKGIVGLTLPALSRDGLVRRASAVTVRVRNLTCEGLATGSGVVVGPATLVTNRHVVAGAERLEVDTADGRSLDVSAAEVGVLGDVAIVAVDGTLPVAADLDGEADQGDEVTAVGYPLGGPLTLTRGVVVDRLPGDGYSVQAPVLRITAEVQPGNSGGPLLDGRGRVAGIVYAYEPSTGFGLAIPMSSVEELLDRGGVTDVPPCGGE